jgi:hypothetical protein
MGKVRKPNISVCYTPSSEPYSINMIEVRFYELVRMLDIILYKGSAVTPARY